MSYRMIFDSLLMNCKLCHMEKPMNIKDFKIHLQVDHSKKLETYKGGYEYVAKTA